MINIRVRPLQLFVIESVVITCVVLLLAYRFYSLVHDSADPNTPPPPTHVAMGRYANAAVVSNGEQCADVGTDILQKGGNSVDAAIATMLCDCVVCPDLTGIGGGFLMTIYNRTTNTSLFINAREVAPAAANSTMFTKNPKQSLTGALAVAVPGMLRGIRVTYNLYGGGVPWASLVEPAIQLCEEGIAVSRRLAANIKLAKDLILNTRLREYFVNNQTGEIMKQGDIYKMPKLCETLRTLASEGSNAVHAGSLTSQFVDDIQSAGGIITTEDLASYVVKVESSFEIRLRSGYKLYSGLPPGSGILLAYILRLLDGKLLLPNTSLDAVRLVEVFKFVYAERSYLGDHSFVDASEILQKVTSDIYVDGMKNKISDQFTSSDPEYYGSHFSWPEDHGTENIAVIDADGSAVVVTSTINMAFGSGLLSPSTGIILNNQMNDFSTPGVKNYYGFPPSPSNFIQPFKRPMSSLCPTVITDRKGDVVLAIGGAGGPKIPLATAYVAALVLWHNKTLKEAIEEPRLYHQLIPMRVEYEYGVLKPIVEELKRVGHRLRRMMKKNKSAVTAIHKTPEGLITVMADFRQEGNVSGY